MKTKITIKNMFTLLACFMGLAVVLASAHAKDVVRASHPTDVATIISRPGDINAKAIGDLHNHIDKQTLKNIAMDNPQAARERELKGVVDENRARGIAEIIEEMVAFYRLAFAMRFSLATA